MLIYWRVRHTTTSGNLWIVNFHIGLVQKWGHHGERMISHDQPQSHGSRQPALLLLDEATSAIDPATQDLRDSKRVRTTLCPSQNQLIPNLLHIPTESYRYIHICYIWLIVTPLTTYLRCVSKQPDERSRHVPFVPFDATRVMPGVGARHHQPRLPHLHHVGGGTSTGDHHGVPGPSGHDVVVISCVAYIFLERWVNL